ncbi:hypothetical protein D3C85_1521250 [compost metagenome]
MYGRGQRGFETYAAERAFSVMGVINLKHFRFTLGICKRIRDRLECATGKVGGDTVVQRSFCRPGISGRGNFYRNLTRTRIKTEIGIGAV